MKFVYRVFIFLLDRPEPARRSFMFLIVFLTVIISAIVCLSAVLSVKPTRNAVYDTTLAEHRAEHISQAVKNILYLRFRNMNVEHVSLCISSSEGSWVLTPCGLNTGLQG
jgi:hypothetical protein